MRRELRVLSLEDYEKYKHLVEHIIEKHFSWAFRTNGGESAMTVVRRYDRDDLLQEGRLGFLEAWQGFDENHSKKSKFTTYAYYAIYWKVFRFVYDNLTPISLRGYKNDVAKDTADARGRFCRALSCQLFSEMKGSTSDYQCEIAARSSKDVDMTEEEQECWEKMQGAFKPWEIDILLQRSDGVTYESIGQYMECSREKARQTVHRLLSEMEGFVDRELIHD